MSTDHNRLDALRRLAKDRAATPAEKATARRLAEALAAKIGKRPRRSRRKGPNPALPEPPAAKWRRLWVLWLEAALDKIEVAGSWVHMIWIASIIGLALMFVFGTEAVRRQAGEVYVVRALGLLAALFLLVPLAGLFKFLAWWLKTWKRERLRPALVFLAQHVPLFATLAATMGVSAHLENHFEWPNMLAFAAATALTFAIVIPWYRWAHPPIERALLQASNGVLRIGVMALAIAVTVTILATGGVWAFVNPRVAPAPPEFEVLVPTVRKAVIAGRLL